MSYNLKDPETIKLMAEYQKVLRQGAKADDPERLRLEDELKKKRKSNLNSLTHDERNDLRKKMQDVYGNES